MNCLRNFDLISTRQNDSDIGCHYGILIVVHSKVRGMIIEQFHIKDRPLWLEASFLKWLHIWHGYNDKISNSV